MKKRNSPTEMKEWRRKQAFQLKEQGYSDQEMSQSLGVTKGVISHWMKRVAQLGEEGGRPVRTREARQN